MACNFINVRKTTSCKENFSGVGSKFYVFHAPETAVNVSDVTSFAEFGTKMASAIGSSVYQVDIKPKSGKVTSTSNPNGGGFTNVFTAVVASSMEKMSELARSLNNDTEWGALIPCGNNEYYILFDSDFGIEFSMESDTGDTSDSDHGHTVTITCGPMLYALPKVSIESLTVASEESGS